MNFRLLLTLGTGFGFLGLSGLFPGAREARAQVPKVTAGEVVDRESLKGFVTWATAEFAAVTDINVGTRLLQDFRTEGSDWNVGNMYLILFTTDGHIFIHGEDPNLDGKYVAGVMDDDGTRVVEQLVTADAVEGKFVQWCWDDPVDPTDVRCKDSFALRYTSLVAGVDLVVVGGYYQDLTHFGEPLPEIPLPEVTAADVVDRETLKQFVEGSIVWLSELVAQVGFTRANQWKAVLREEGGPFKSGPIYLFVFTPEAYVIFHGADAWREGRTVLDNTDFQGRPFVRDIIAVAQSGGGFVEYFWDDPTVEGDEDTGTPKVSYARSVESTVDVFQDFEFIVGAGFYRNFSTAEAEDASKDWLARFGRSVASQAMEMIGYRVSLTNSRDDHLVVGGRTLSLGSFLNPATLAAAGAAGPAALLPLSSGRLLGETSFQASPGGAAGGGGVGFWGGGEFMRFDNDVGSGFSKGDVSTAALGADYEFGAAMAGVAVTYSQGSGDFELGRAGDDDVGAVTTTLTSAFPYARLAISERVYAWSVLGYGVGTLNIEGGGEQDPESDISMQMAGLGMKGAIVPSRNPRDVELSVRSDAVYARMNSDEVEGRSELATDVSRIRLGLEASKGIEIGAGSVLEPAVRAGLRHDGGDIETGFGLEVGGEVKLAAMDGGLIVSVHGRSLVTHEQSGYDEWGVGGSITFDPGSRGRGLSLDLRPTWGSTSSGLARLWAQGAAGMTGDAFGRQRMDAEIGYGVDTPGARGVLIPYARLTVAQQPGPEFMGMGALSSPGSPAAVNQGTYGYRLGGRLTLADNFLANLEAGRSTWSAFGGPEHNARLNLALTW